MDPPRDSLELYGLRGKRPFQEPYEDLGSYEHLCETYTWTGVCANGADCPQYHNPDRLPYLWLIGEEGQWSKSHDSVKLEKQFCGLGDFIPKCPGVFSDSYVMSAKVKSIEINPSTNLRRLSTPSYVTAAPGIPLNFYTQWVWYRRERDGTYTPFYPGNLQYTLEDKYLTGQHKYHFEVEAEKLRLMVDMKSLKQTNQDTKRSTKLLRRPIFVTRKKSKIPEMSPLLLHDVVEHVHQVPDHWSVVDRYQDFELVELPKAEYTTVHKMFFSTMDRKKHKITHIFRVQNPRQWDKYCSARRAMTPRDQRPEEVEERQLFHGTPTLQAARGICANSFDFRRSGENVGARWGKGAYFSTTAYYSHTYTRPYTPVTGETLRFMFLGRILVGQYILGKSSYTKPPERDGLKLYDSCVNDVFNPTIFVIFDLAQSYPEYLIQYTDVSDSTQEPQLRPAVSVPSLVATVSPVDTTPGTIGRRLRALSLDALSLTLSSTPSNDSSSSSRYGARSHKISTFKRKIKKCVIS